jgi:glycosyltransferase involved in cell wall biosynthesis
LGPEAPELRILGGGDLRANWRHGHRIAGALSGASDAANEAQRQIAQARLLVLPSECFEGFPMVVREAFAFGTPAAVSDLGPLPSIVRHGESGVVFKAANSDSLLQTVRTCLASAGPSCKNSGKGREPTFDANYSDEEANYRDDDGRFTRKANADESPIEVFA